MLTDSEKVDSISSSTDVKEIHPGDNGPRPAALTVPIFVVVCTILFCLTALLSASLYFQHLNYSEGVNSALKGSQVDHNSLITYSRAWDFAVIKTSALFLAFTLIFVGSLYVLRVADSSYSLRVEGKDIHGSLETSSPGLVMITLGVILVGLVLYDKSLIDYRPTPTTPSISPEGPVSVVPQTGEGNAKAKSEVSKEQSR